MRYALKVTICYKVMQLVEREIAVVAARLGMMHGKDHCES